MKNASTLLSRRSALKLGTAGLALYATGLPTSALAQTTPRRTLAIPPLELGTLSEGTRRFDLRIAPGEMDFFDGVHTKTMGINGEYLGPVLRFRAGETVQLKVSNALDEPTTLHWHGFSLPAKSDGGPHQIIAPDDNWTAEFEVRQKAATMWYHSHFMEKTAEQVWAGVAGMVIIDDDEADALNLPSTYGVDDIPVVLQDRVFNSYGQMPYRLSMHSRNMGMSGNVALVNGTVGAFFDVKTSLVRLRLLNASNASIYTLGFADGRLFTQIASDGGLLAAPEQVKFVRLAPAERAEIIVDMSGGAPVMLRNFAAGGGMMRGMMGGEETMLDFLELRPSDSLSQSTPLPATLAELPTPDPAQAVRVRPFVLEMRGMMMINSLLGGGFTINGKSMDPRRIDEVVKLGDTEIWRVSNNSQMAHPFHVHNTQFRIVSRNGARPHAVESGLKDTVLVHPGEVVDILVRFDRNKDEQTPYMYHCHILEHEDAGMMGQFTVV